MARKKRSEIETRRIEVARMLLEGCSQREMAHALSVGPPTINRDVKAIRQEWQERRIELMDTVGAEDLARTDAAIVAIWKKVQDGQLGAVDRLVSLLQYRAKVLGLEAPAKTEVDVGEVLADILEKLTDDAAA